MNIGDVATFRCCVMRRPVSVYHGVSAAALQALLAVGLLGWLLLTPPAAGKMMLIPITDRASEALPSLALRGTTKLIAAGPIPGSLIVYGKRSGLARMLLAHGIMTIATPLDGCAPEPVA